MEINNHHRLLILLSISAIVFVSFSSTDAAAAPRHHARGTVPPVADPNVKSVCDKAQEPALCMSTVSPLLFGKTDPASILVACLKRCLNEDKLTMKKIPTCQESYESASEYLKEALAGFKTKALADIQSKIGTARVDVSTCVDDLNDLGDADPKAMEVATKLKNMVLACEDISFNAKIF